MPLIHSQPPITSADVSDEALSSLEPSTLLVELDRLENSIQKLKESNAALEELTNQHQSHLERIPGNDDDDDEGEEATAVTDEERQMFEEVRKENEQVIARQSLLLSRIQHHIENQGGLDLARSSDPHLAFHSQGGQATSIGSLEMEVDNANVGQQV